MEHSVRNDVTDFTKWGCVGRIFSMLARKLGSIRRQAPGLEASGNDTPYLGETLLAQDIEILRHLEAEMYSLNDQFNTETNHRGAPAS